VSAGPEPATGILASFTLHLWSEATPLVKNSQDYFGLHRAPKDMRLRHWPKIQLKIWLLQ
jgi:hypothetical protein